MTQQLNEKKLLELLEFAKVAEQKMRQSNEGLTALAEKWQHRAKKLNTRKFTNKDKKEDADKTNSYLLSY